MSIVGKVDPMGWLRGEEGVISRVVIKCHTMVVVVVVVVCVGHIGMSSLTTRLV